ncbi:Crp/Fnr family transcriptional regulator [Desertivirga brevis]|uniref:Crp/Fnr family transcriptional regulator n=1 Tax=Desertivirga brevis TaxID=2810310 RepID=UPI001A962A3C|nr:Crp/Fnr family transcriptional regulator [Pedobacter sp. SYSU D00873]
MLKILRKHIEKIVELTDEEFAFVESLFEVKTSKKGEYLFQVGEKVKYCYFVVSGLLKLVYDDEDGNRHIVAFAMEDWWESDFSAYYNQTPATMSLQCLEDTQVLCLSIVNYKILLSGLQKIEHFLLEKANSGHISVQQRILSFLTSSAKGRYEQLIRKYPSLLQRVPKSQLASYLGVSRETLSRLSR